MDTNDLKQYPLASLYGWRSALFVTPQGVSDEAVERREIRQRVFDETAKQRYALDLEDFADLL